MSILLEFQKWLLTRPCKPEHCRRQPFKAHKKFHLQANDARTCGAQLMKTDAVGIYILVAVFFIRIKALPATRSTSEIPLPVSVSFLLSDLAEIGTQHSRRRQTTMVEYM